MILPCRGDDSVYARVTELSDRKYEKALIELLDNAKESIVISMYSISPATAKKNPVRLLLNDLLEARSRGVSVTMYLNTAFPVIEEGGQSFINGPIFRQLKKSGCVIYLMPQARRLHDKLIIVDNRYVIIGSTNWSTSALRTNFESNTLIDSPPHAREKLKRLEEVLEFTKANSKITSTPYYLQNLPKDLSIARKFVISDEYLSLMIRKKDSRAFDLYLLLLAHSQSINERKFFINLEDMGLSLGLPKTWSHSALRRQVIKSLNRLKNSYNLISVTFFHSKDTFIELVDITGGYFPMPSDYIIECQKNKFSLRLKCLYLIETLLKSQGEDLYSLTKTAIAERFNLDRGTVLDAFKDLKKQKPHRW